MDDGVLVESDVVDAGPWPPPLDEESGEEEIELLCALVGHFEEEIKLYDVGGVQFQVVDFEIFVILDFPGVIVMGDFADLDIAVGLDFEAHEHFLLQRHLPLHRTPYISNRLPEMASRRVLVMVKRCIT